MSKDFKREDSHKKKQTPDSWRSPTGKHSDVRLEKKGAAPKPKAGRRKDSEVRGLHPSGYDEVLVNRPEDLEEIEEGEAAMIASKVGGRKRSMIMEKADEMDIKVLNGDTE
ncbi:MAG: 50S ribosomal protein L32e [Candidatus Nanohaloarchaea archaeon]